MTIEAKFIKEAGKMRGLAHLFELSELVPYGWDEDSDRPTTKFVIASSISNEWGSEVYIFPADAAGKITDWGEMEGSFKGAGSPQDAIENAGWVVVNEFSTVAQ